MPSIAREMINVDRQRSRDAGAPQSPTSTQEGHAARKLSSNNSNRDDLSRVQSKLREKEKALEVLSKSYNTSQRELECAKSQIEVLKSKLSRRDETIGRLKDRPQQEMNETLVSGTESVKGKEPAVSRQPSTSTTSDQSRFLAQIQEKDALIQRLQVELQRTRDAANESVVNIKTQLEKTTRDLVERTQQLAQCDSERSALASRYAALQEQQKRSISESTRSCVVRSAGIEADGGGGLQAVVGQMVKRYATADVSGESIMALVREMNKMVGEIAKTAETLCEKRSRGHNPIENSAKTFLKRVLGNELFEKISRPQTKNPRGSTWTEVALKAVISHRMFNFQEAWPLSSIIPSQTGSELRNTYRQIQRREPQQIAALWRAVTAKHVRLSSDSTSSIVQEISSRSLEDISNILIQSGASPQPKQVRNAVRTGLVQRVDMLWSRAALLAEKTKEHALQADYQLLLAIPRMSFDAPRMVSALPRSSFDPPPGPVIATTEVGLCLASSTVGTRTGDGVESEPMGIVLLKASVVCSEAI